MGKEQPSVCAALGIFRQTRLRREVQQWSTDAGDSDDPMLIEQIRTKVLPQRGITSAPDEILVTMVKQHALHLLSEVLIPPGSQCGVEEPGAPEMRYLARRRGASGASDRRTWRDRRRPARRLRHDPRHARP